jgi:hypothetical protein
LLSHSTQSAISCLNSPKALPYQSRQFLSMTASKLLGPVLPLIRKASVSKSSGVQSVGIATGTSLYCSKAMQFGSSRLRILVSGCCKRSTSITGRPVLLQASCGSKTPPPLRSVAKRTAARSLPLRTIELYFRAINSSSTVLQPLPTPLMASPTMSCTRALYWPPINRSSRHSTLRLMSRALITPRLFRRTHVTKIRARSEFHLRSRPPVNSLAIVDTTCWPSPPLGGLYNSRDPPPLPLGKTICCHECDAPRPPPRLTTSALSIKKTTRSVLPKVELIQRHQRSHHCASHAHDHSPPVHATHAIHPHPDHPHALAHGWHQASMIWQMTMTAGMGPDPLLSCAGVKYDILGGGGLNRHANCQNTQNIMA